ncbi:glycosyltransferase family 1 protein [Halobacteriales archaeon QS_3_64_16]|nr:MAG: glycosyltransferase family 1 protein [Halobacteriales archaeon QS_3_64_16]
MKIGFFVYGEVETTSGGFLYDRKLIENLRERGDSVEVIELPWPSYPRGLVSGFTTDLDRLEGDFDLFLQDELAHPTLLGLNARLRRKYGTPIVSIVHHLRCSETGPRSAKVCYRAIERRYLRGIDAAICNSAFTQESVLDLATLPTTVAPPAGDRVDPAIDAETIADRARDEPFEVIFLGSVIERKGLDTLIEGLARLPNERWRLRIVGDTGVEPAYTRHVHRTISRLGVGERVSLLGALPDEALAAVLEGSHLLAIPSTHEGFGIAYLEGMGFGLPALATTAGGASEVVIHGETGYLCSPGDVGAIARRVRTLADDREALATMGIAAREHYETHPTWAESAAQAGDFLDRVLAGEIERETTGAGEADGRDSTDGDRNGNSKEERNAVA